MTDYIVINTPYEYDIQDDYINENEVYKLFAPETPSINYFNERDLFDYNKLVVIGSDNQQRANLATSLIIANDYDKLIFMDPSELEAQRYHSTFPDAEYYDYDQDVIEDVIIEQQEDNTRIIMVFDNIDYIRTPGYLSSSGTFRKLMESPVTVLILQSTPAGSYYVPTLLKLIFVLREENPDVKRHIYNTYSTLPMNFPTFDQFEKTLMVETDPTDFVYQVTHTTPCLVLNYKTQSYETYDFNNNYDEFPLTDSYYSSESSHSEESTPEYSDESSPYQGDYLEVLDELVNVLNETNRTVVDEVVDFMYYTFCSCFRP